MWENCPDNPDPHGGGGSGRKKIHEMYGNELFDKRSNGAIILTTKKILTINFFSTLKHFLTLNFLKTKIFDPKSFFLKFLDPNNFCDPKQKL